MQLRGKWMRKQILPSAPFVGVQGIINYELKVGRRRQRRRGSGRRASVRHECESKEWVIVGAVVGGQREMVGMVYQVYCGDATPLPHVVDVAARHICN